MDDIILPSDYQETATPSADEINPETTATEVETTTSQQTEQTTEPQRIKVKFNHEEKEITLDEAVQLAQKGMNYDKVTEKLNALQSNPALSFVEQQAKKFGLTTDQYIEAVRQQEEAEAIRQLAEKEGVSEEVANRLFRLEQRESERARKESDAEQQSQSQKKIEADALEFAETYPDAKLDELPDSFWQDVNKGKSLVDAYAKLENQLLKDRLKKLEHNAEVAKKTPVSGVSVHGSTEVAEEDDFLKGFNSFD